MRVLRKPATLAMAAAVVMAVSAVSAQAAEVEVESTGANCTNIVKPVHGPGSGGCRMRIVNEGNIVFRSRFFGFLLTDTCTSNIFEGRIQHNGEGFIYSALFLGCTLPYSACDVDGNGVMENWDLEITTEPPSVGSATQEMRFCVVIAGQTYNCHLGLDLNEDSAHRYELRTGAGVTPPARQCENIAAEQTFAGHWTQAVDAAHPAIEITD